MNKYKLENKCLDILMEINFLIHNPTYYINEVINKMKTSYSKLQTNKKKKQKLYEKNLSENPLEELLKQMNRGDLEYILKNKDEFEEPHYFIKVNKYKKIWEDYDRLK